jgi:hypothetical protein
MRRRRIVSACVAVSVLMLNGLVALAQPTYFELYDQAVAHIARREWAQAETKLKAAKAASGAPAPGRNRLRYGMLRADFLPDFYLGIVYRNTGRPDEALASFKLTQSLIGPREKAQFDSEYQLAIADRDKRTLAQNTTTSVPATTTTVLPAPPSPTTTTVGPTPQARFALLIAQAKTELSRRQFQNAVSTAGEARKLNVDNTQADDVIRQARTVPLAEDVERQLAARNVAAVQQAIDALAAVDQNDSRLAAYRTQLQTLTSGILIARAEREAMRLYFVGNYQASLKALQQAEQQGALSPRLRFYRACSLAALALSAEPQDTSRMAQAREQYKQVPTGTLDADRRFISPKILRALVGAS